ncbi:CD5 antigen-like isoform X2 [Hyperolius riggenbachi]|uniref:CD5 antigen-like isoform X2 n=1 Tax=Hyperolius riggenbachi TaxID=752182 RepID=UPI0035A2D391
MALFLLGESLKIRLVDGPHSCSGKLEVHHHEEWRSVCGHKWHVLNTKVVCKELNCGSPVRGKPCRPMKEESGKIWQKEPRCTGKEEALSECLTKPIKERQCPYKEDAWVTCREPFQVRLVDGPDRCTGRLEVYHDGQWGNVCDDLWDAKDANVTCAQIKCGSSQPDKSSRKRIGQSNGKIWLDDVECNGNEASLEKCRHRVWGYHDCSHEEDVTVYCTGKA